MINITKHDATIPSKIEKEVGMALLAFAIDPKSVILVAVNGEEPRKMSWSRLDEKIDAPPDEAVARVAIDFVVAALPAPGTRTPAQKFWLEPRAARLADECVAALVAGEPMPRDHLKKLHVMKDLGDDRGARGLDLDPVRRPPPGETNREEDEGDGRAAERHDRCAL